MALFESYERRVDKINEVLKEYFKKLNVTLVDFKIEFGKTVDGEIVLADEISVQANTSADAFTKEWNINGETVTITWAEPIHFYRCLSLIPQPLAKCDIHEKVGFQSSRNRSRIRMARAPPDIRLSSFS